MPVYLPSPQFRIVTNYGGSNYSFINDQAFSGNIIRRENGFDVATLDINDYKGTNVLSKMDSGSAITIEFKDQSETSYTKVFDGKIRFINLPFGEKGEVAQLKCDGKGYGLEETACGQQYGSESTNSSLDTIQEIITDATNGIVPKWVNKILGTATDSGHSYTANSTTVENIAGSMRYFYFPYKPSSKAINDVCDVLQAIKGAGAGPHWIVDTSGNFLLCTLNADHPDAANNGWYKYYGNSLANATLAQEKDFNTFYFQKLDKEANYILYHGALQKPADGDKWTENNAASWGGSNITVSNENGAGLYKVGSYSIKGLVTVKAVSENFFYPSAQNMALDISKLGGQYNIPTFGFWARRNATLTLAASPDPLTIWFVTNWATSIVWSVQIDLTKFLIVADKWYAMTVPIGDYWRTAQPTSDAFLGIEAAGGGGNWGHIDWIGFNIIDKDVNSALYIDGMKLNGQVLRAARETTIDSTNKLRVKIITDDVGKDDSLIASDDSGTMARLAYAELLRSKSTPIIGWVRTPLIKDILPGQLVHTHAKKKSDGTFSIDKDMRVTEITHEFAVSPNRFWTTLNLTDDLTNSLMRRGFDDFNMVLRNARQFEDRQATSIKTKEIDITQSILEKSY